MRSADETGLPMTPIQPRRSALYMPASNARALDKARTIPCDVVILDLEDAVAPPMKEIARAQALSALAAGGYERRELVLRVNAPDTPWHDADLAAAARSGAHAVLLPKVSDPVALQTVADKLDRSGAPADLEVWAMIETARGVLDIARIAAAGGRLACLVLGTNDLARETRVRMAADRAALLPWLQQVLLAARANDLDCLDGVFGDIADMPGFVRQAQQGRDLGFDGKTLIHPVQVEPANTAFTPTAEEIAQARRILAAFDSPAHAGIGVLALDGVMIERLHAEMAARTVALAEAVGASTVRAM